MLPSFITTYKDNKQHIHLYFYPGMNDDGTYIYETVKLDNVKIKYTEEKHIDGSIDFKFFSNTIVRFHCKLINHKTQKEIYQTTDVK